MIDEHWMDVGRGLWFSRSTWFVWNEADFSSQMQRVVQFIQGNMKVLGIPISVCLTSVLHCEKKSTKTFEFPNIMNTFTKLKEKTG